MCANRRLFTRPNSIDKDNFMKTVSIGPLSFNNTFPFGLIAGPCVLEGREQPLQIAQHLAHICRDLNIPFIFKSSFDKANRTGIGSRGMSWDEASDIFQEIKSKVGCPIITDVHHPHQCSEVAAVVDVLQIPAFLCRQTDLIQAAAETGKPLNIKKGQFLSPQEIKAVVKKAQAYGNDQIMLCERGVSFGYNTLVNDMRALPIMAETGCPVIFDVTHSVQRPGAMGDKSGGERQFTETLARAAIGVGVAGLFIETHPDPDSSLSDGPNMIPLQFMRGLLSTLKALDDLTKGLAYQEFAASTQRF